MSRLKCSIGLVLCLGSMLAISACSIVFAQNGPTLNLNIVHTNNVEGELDPCTCLMDSAGGAPRRATAVNELRGQYPGLFLVDSGDALFGTPESDANHGISLVKTMNVMKYDAAALGDQEFMYGLDILQAVIDQAAFPYLSANVVHKDTQNAFVRESIVFERDGHRVAFLGLTSPDVDIYFKADPKLSSSLQVLDPIQTARTKVPQLGEKSDAVIILSDLGSTLDRKLIEAVPGITAVIGGHSREIILPEGEHSAVPLVQMGFQGDQLGVLHLVVDNNAKTIEVQSEQIRLTRKIKTDPDILAVVMPYKAQAALHGLIDFSLGLSSLLPLEVHRADKDTQRAYLGALAYPGIFKAEPYPGSKGVDAKNLLSCFLSSYNQKENQVDFSLRAVSEPECVQLASSLLNNLPDLVLPTRIANP